MNDKHISPHSKLPWKINSGYVWPDGTEVYGDRIVPVILPVATNRTKEHSYKDAEFIVEACNNYHHLQEENQRLKESQRWISVEKQLPPDYEQVLGYFPNGTEGGKKVATAIYDGENLRSDFPNSTAYCFKATHWQPLPPTPDITAQPEEETK